MKTFSAGQRVAASDLYPGGLVATFFTQAGTIMTTPAGGTETAMATNAWNANSDASVTISNGRLYAFEVAFGVYDNVSETFAVIVRLRKSMGSTTALQLGYWKPFAPPIGAAIVAGANGKTYVKNVSGADIAITPGFTIARSVGTGTVALYGDTNLECSVNIYDVGATSDSSLAARLAGAVALT